MVGTIGFFTGTVFLGMGFIMEIVRYRNECRERVEQVKTLAKIIEKLNKELIIQKGGSDSDIKYPRMDTTIINNLKTRKLDFFWPNLNNNHAYYWLGFWVIYAFLHEIVVTSFF
jgi:hypothetical protein